MHVSEASSARRIFTRLLFAAALVALLVPLATLAASLRRIPSQEDVRALLVQAKPVARPLKSALLAVTSPEPLDELVIAEIAYIHRYLFDSSTLGHRCGASTAREVARSMIPQSSNHQRSLDVNTLAIIIERSLSDEEQTAIFASQIQLGGNSPGVESAARRWFATTANELSVAESAELVALWGSPQRLAAADGARQIRRTHILDLMMREGLVSTDEVRDSLLVARKFHTPK